MLLGPEGRMMKNSTATTSFARVPEARFSGVFEAAYGTARLSDEQMKAYIQKVDAIASTALTCLCCVPSRSLTAVCPMVRPQKSAKLARQKHPTDDVEFAASITSGTSSSHPLLSKARPPTPGSRVRCQ